MSRMRKLYEKAKRNPAGMRFEELDALLCSAGFEARQPRSGSSHYFYKKGTLTITVPRHRSSLGASYVRRALSLLKEDFEDEQGPEDS